MSRGEKWSLRDPDYRAGYRIGRAQARAANGTPARQTSGCALWLWAYILIPLAGIAAGLLFGVWS